MHGEIYVEKFTSEMTLIRDGKYTHNKYFNFICSLKPFHLDNGTETTTVSDGFKIKQIGGV